MALDLVVQPGEVCVVPGEFLVFGVVAYLLARRLRLPAGPTVLVLLAGTIPVLTFVVERWLTRRYINPALAAAPSAQPVSR